MKYTATSNRSLRSGNRRRTAFAACSRRRTPFAACGARLQSSAAHPHDTVFSTVKAIGITAVVAGHAAIGTPIERFVYLFHIALFFFVAGYFFDDAQTARPLGFVGRKLRRLYVPYVLWGSLFVLLHNLFLHLHLIGYDFAAHAPMRPYDNAYLLHTIGRVLLFHHHEQMLSPFWFLQGLFLGLICFYAVTFVGQRLGGTPKRSERLRGALILLLFAGAVGLLRHPLGLPDEAVLTRALIIAGVIYLGKLYALFRERIPLRTLPAVGCLLFLLVAAAAGYRINIGARELGNPLLFVAVTCAGCYMTLVAARAWVRHGGPTLRIADYTGRHSMAVMLWHIPVFKLVTLIQIGIYDYPIRYLSYPLAIPKHVYVWWIPYTLAGIFVPLGFCLLCDRLRRSARS